MRWSPVSYTHLEEFGLLGAKSYVKTHAKELGKIANRFNRDGGPTPPVGISVPHAMYDDFVEVCKPVKEIRADYPFEVKVACSVEPSFTTAAGIGKV